MKVNRQPVRGESWDRGPLFTCYFWKNDNSAGRQTQVITGKKWNGVCPSERKSEKGGEKHHSVSLRSWLSDGLFHRSSNYGNEERWSQTNKSHNFRLKCMNICFCCGTVHLSVRARAYRDATVRMMEPDSHVLKRKRKYAIIRTGSKVMGLKWGEWVIGPEHEKKTHL